MGIFNEQSSNQHYQFAKGIQGALALDSISPQMEIMIW